MEPLLTLVWYVAIAFGVLTTAIVIACLWLAVGDRVGDYLADNYGEPVDETPWEDWDWPIPDDLNAWNLPASEFED